MHVLCPTGLTRCRIFYEEASSTMPLPTIFGEARVVADPELRFTPSGKGVASVRLVADRSRKNENNEWETVSQIWMTGTMWNSDHGNEAENLCESLTKGDLVEFRGEVSEREYETKEGEKRKAIEVTLRAIGPSLKRATAKVTKATRSAPAEGQSQASAAPADDPWATPQQSSEPPF